MSRRVPVQEIRGSDPTLLEVQLSEMLRRPLGQLHPANVMDLIELATTEGRPRSLDRGLQAFVPKMAREIADIPNGPPFREFLDELRELPGERVPHQFREILAAEADREGRTDEGLVADLLALWAGEEPAPFEMGVRRARVVRTERRAPRGSSSEPSSAPRERTRQAGRAGSAAPRASRAGSSTADDGRLDLIRDLCLEKLARASENGLGEPILLAGVRHQVKDQYPDVKPAEILAVLRSLKDGNQVRYSAGRWSLAARFS